MLDTLIKFLISSNWFGATYAVGLDISNAFDRVKHAGYLQVFGLIYFFSVVIIDGFKRFWMWSLRKNIQLMLYFVNAPFLVLHLSYYTLMIFRMMLYVILLSMLMILLWQQLEFAAEFESDLWDTVDWGRKRLLLLISMLERLNWFHLTSLITLVLLMWKLMCLFLRKNHFLGWLFLLNWIGALKLSLLLKMLP